MDTAVFVASTLVLLLAAVAVGGLYGLAFVQVRLALAMAWPEAAAPWRLAALGLAFAAVNGLAVPLAELPRVAAVPALAAAPVLLAFLLLGHGLLLRRPAWTLCRLAPAAAAPLRIDCTVLARRLLVLAAASGVVATVVHAVLPSSLPVAAAPLVPFAAVLAVGGGWGVGLAGLAVGLDGLATSIVPEMPGGPVGAALVLAATALPRSWTGS